MHISNQSIIRGTRFQLHLVALAVCLLLAATTGAFADINDGKQLPAFKTSVPVREYGTGAHVGAFGGVNLAQSGDVDVTDSALPGRTVTFNTKNQLGGVAGIRGGYTWPSWGSSLQDVAPLDGSFAVVPSLEYEMFWTGYKYKGDTSLAGVNVEYTSDVNVYVFSLDPKIGFQIGMFRHYIGAGIGGAYINADNAKISAAGVSVSPGGSADDFCLALQGLAGVEVFIAKNWSITADYKFLNLINPEFDAGTTHYKSDVMSQHIVTAGVNFYF